MAKIKHKTTLIKFLEDKNRAVFLDIKRISIN